MTKLSELFQISFGPLLFLFTILLFGNKTIKIQALKISKGLDIAN